MIFKLIWIIVFVSVGLSEQEKALKLDDILAGKFNTAYIPIQWISNEDQIIHFQYDSTLKTRHILKVDLLNGDTSTFISAQDLVWNGSHIFASNVSLNQSGNKALIKTKKKSVWRYSSTAEYFIYDLKTKELGQVGDGDRLSNIKFSPNGEMVAYCKSDNNIYMMKLKSGQERQLTRKGSETILNGKLGWLYEEEFGLYDGFSWSPDSKYIAFYREDQSMVKPYYLMNDDSLYSEIKSIYYPKAGEVNPKLKIGIVRVSGGTTWLPIEGNNEMYLPRMNWGRDGKLYLQSLNRLQNELILYRYNVNNRKLNSILRETSKTWVNVNDAPIFLNDGSFLWYSSKSGFKHVYRIKNHKMTQLTTGNWSVNQVEYADEQNGVIYITGKKDSPLDNHLYRVSLNGGSLKKVSQSTGWHTVHFSPSGKYWIDHSSSMQTLPRYDLRSSDGELVRTIKESSNELYSEIPFTEKKNIKVQTKDGTILDASIALPWNFDASKRYPVLVYGYGLPNAQTVKNQWGGRRYLFHQMFAQEGIIIASINNRQGGGYGQEFMDHGYMDLGHYLINDHIALIHHLGSHSWADTSKVGIWGWSGGGYLTSLALTKGASTFDVGIAVAPVTDWKYYDSAYTERFMGLPKSNIKGYKSASVMTYIDQFSGKLLVIHGTGDDNVHVQHTHQLVNEFVKAGKQVDLFLYPGRTHGIYGGNAQNHLYHKMYQYFIQHLK